MCCWKNITLKSKILWENIQKCFGIYVYSCPYCDFRTNMEWVAEAHKIFHEVGSTKDYQLVSM